MAKGRNLAIAEYPTNSKVGNRGYADYALFVGEKLVGIIEAKAIVGIIIAALVIAALIYFRLRRCV